MRRALVATWLLVAGASCGGDTTSCRDGTVLLTIDLDAATRSADTLAFDLALGGAHMTSSKTRAGGGASETVEIDFAGGYPSGAQLTVDVTALAGGRTLGRGHAAMALASGCTAMTVDVTGGAITDAGSDGAPVDASGTVDASTPSDGSALVDGSPLGDASVPIDAAAPADFSSLDGSSPVDQAAPPDATLDASVPRDGEPARDAVVDTHDMTAPPDQTITIAKPDLLATPPDLNGNTDVDQNGLTDVDQNGNTDTDAGTIGTSDAPF